jgi:regulator of replication initiation timing
MKRKMIQLGMLLAVLLVGCYSGDNSTRDPVERLASNTVVTSKQIEEIKNGITDLIAAKNKAESLALQHKEAALQWIDVAKRERKEKEEVVKCYMEFVRKYGQISDVYGMPQGPQITLVLRVEEDGTELVNQRKARK